MTAPWSVNMTATHWDQLTSHLFPGDGDEHAAVLRCGIASTPRGTRLLVRDIVLATDGTDYIEGDRGYRKLVPEFVLDVAESCADDGLVYLAVHCHGGYDHVGFSQVDLASHERGYPALLDITASPAVGALVFAKAAVAGDIWTAARTRWPIEELRVVGRPELRLRPEPLEPPRAQAGYDRQARIFGDRGQDLLGRLRVAVVGLGGAGSLISEYLARLGVGELLLIDPERIEDSNLSRVVGARRLDAMTWLTGPGRPKWLRKLGNRLSTPKVAIAARVARQASRMVKVIPVVGDITYPEVAELLKTCDHIFLAADSHSARHVVDAVTHQYLVPSTQVGAKVSAVASTGVITDIFSVSRMSTPGSGCLRCNQLINPAKLAEEGQSTSERRRQRYIEGEEVPAPSVITLNAVAASHAVNDWLISVTGLTAAGVDQNRWVMFHPLLDEIDEFEPRQDPNCPTCGSNRFALGDAKRLPTRVR